MKEKAIYGLAMPFNIFYKGREQYTDFLQYELTTRESIQMWIDVKLTLEHDDSRILGTTNQQNLLYVINDSGIYFKCVPNTPMGFRAYEDVKAGLLNYCSVTYLRRCERDYDLEKKMKSFTMLINRTNNFMVKKHVEVLVHEMCITNDPGSKETFCTTNKNDPRLKGIKWESGTV